MNSSLQPFLDSLCLRSHFLSPSPSFDTIYSFLSPKVYWNIILGSSLVSHMSEDSQHFLHYLLNSEYFFINLPLFLFMVTKNNHFYIWEIKIKQFGLHQCIFNSSFILNCLKQLKIINLLILYRKEGITTEEWEDMDLFIVIQICLTSKNASEVVGYKDIVSWYIFFKK